jgi:hypothetical protein
MDTIVIPVPGRRQPPGVIQSHPGGNRGGVAECPGDGTAVLLVLVKDFRFL